MGFASGFQVGQQAVERGIKLREEDQERKRIREAMGLTPQEIAPRPPTEDELNRAQAYTQGIADQDARMFATENSLENRTGLFSSNPAERPLDASVAPQMPYAGQSVGGLQYRLGDQTLNRMPTQQEIESARYSAAANVLAERDPVAAMRMRQEQVRMEREAVESPLRLEQLRQQGILTKGQIEDRERERKRIAGIEAVDADVAKWQESRLLDPNTNELRQATPDDNIASLQYRATALRKAGFAKEATDSLKDYQSFAVNQITLDDKARTSRLGAVAAALATGDLEPARAFYDRFVLDGAKVTAMKADPKTGAITVSRVRDDGTPLPDRTIKGGANELLASLNSFRDPMSLYNFSQNEFNNNMKVKELGLRERSVAVQEKNQELAEDTAAFNKIQGIEDSRRKDASLKRPVPSGIKTFKNQDTGEAVLVDVSKLEQNADGTLKLPKGLIPATTKTEPTDAAVAKLADSIMKDRKQWPMKDGKPVAPSPAQAGAMARSILRQNASVVDENESAEDKLIRLMRASQQAQ